MCVSLCVRVCVWFSARALHAMCENRAKDRNEMITSVRQERDTYQTRNEGLQSELKKAFREAPTQRYEDHRRDSEEILRNIFKDLHNK